MQGPSVLKSKPLQLQMLYYTCKKKKKSTRVNTPEPAIHQSHLSNKYIIDKESLVNQQSVLLTQKQTNKKNASFVLVNLTVCQAIAYF